jgi:5-methylcytosine-specific restriction endonuclease McrA
MVSSEQLKYSEAPRKLQDMVEGILRQLIESQFKKKDKDRILSEAQHLDKKHLCSWCGEALSWPRFDVDHVHPHSKGGKTDTLNAALLHPKCNKQKSASRVWM